MVISVSDLDILYPAVPKAGCSSVKAMLAEIDPSFEGEPSDPSSTLLFHRAYPTRRWRKKRFNEFSEGYRFTVVRDPVKRLMSVYTNRVVDKKDLHKSRRLKKRGLLSLDPDPDTFFLNLDRYARLSSSIHHHIIPTRYFTGPGLSVYSRVYKTEEMSTVAEDLGRISGREISVRRSNKSKARLKFEDLQPFTKNTLLPRLNAEYDFLKTYYENPFS